jgi:hypothetical protein
VPNITYMGQSQYPSKGKIPSSYRVPDSTLSFNVPQIPIVINQPESDDDDASSEANTSGNEDTTCLLPSDNHNRQHEQDGYTSQANSQLTEEEPLNKSNTLSIGSVLQLVVDVQVLSWIITSPICMT